jgi:hypothetical protein
MVGIMIGMSFGTYWIMVSKGLFQIGKANRITLSQTTKSNKIVSYPTVTH